MKPFQVAFGVFFLAFGLYLYTAGPGLVPYRDAGEMATSVPILGVLHPTSYPLYSLSGHLLGCLPLANAAYRLNVFSALAMAVAWSFLFLLLQEICGTLYSLLVIALGMVSYQFWTHALVSEMYSLHVAFLTAILFCLNREKYDLAAFLLGLGMGNRMDLVLCVPAFFTFFLKRIDKGSFWRWSLLWLLGFSVYLYLPLRALQNPLLNWNNPSTLVNFLGSLTRRGYGNTLDLLSKSYGMGDNFCSEMVLYVRHLWKDFVFVGLPVAFLGLGYFWSRKRDWFWCTAIGFAVTGPMFIFLGNLPPNPHAVAIMEAAYLVPDIFFLILIAGGWLFLARQRWICLGIVGIAVALLSGHSLQAWAETNQRQNFFALDFLRNVYRSVPPNSLVVARSDVPVFSLFYAHGIYPGRKEVIPIAQGLAGSPWYVAMMERQVPGLRLGRLQSMSEWNLFVRANPGRQVLGTLDVEWPAGIQSQMTPRGLLFQMGSPPFIPFLEALYACRGDYRYEAHRDFFSPELIESYAKAWMVRGDQALRSLNLIRAEQCYRQVLVLKSDMPYAAFQLGYIHFQKKQFLEAAYYYHWAVDSYQQMRREAQEWRSFPEIQDSLRREQAMAYAHWGVSQEQLGDRAKALALYQTALNIDDTNSDAHYNSAVIYWRDANWLKVVEHLQDLARAHPEDPRWKQYLPAAMAKLKGKV